MSFFKAKEQTPPEAWKDKYFALLDSQDELEKSYQTNQDLLCKTIVRFAIAIKGLNKQLDPHLLRIREILKSGVKHQALYDGLQAFSDALITLNDNAQRPDVSLLFDYLERCFPEIRQPLRVLQDQYDQELIASVTALFDALLQLTTPQSPIEHASVINTESSDAETVDSNQHIFEQLQGLLTALEFPELFSSQVDTLKQKLTTEHSLESAMEAVTDLLVSVKKHQDKEQQEITEFLTKLTGQLTEMGLATSSLNSANQAVQERREALDSALTTQLADLQSKSALATQLAPLKELINNRLESVNHQIQAYQQQSLVEREHYQKQLSTLTQKVTALEAESGDLKSRLDAAQHRATRDPLTGLPNRLAYDERIKIELARFRRNATPLTMAIWDIDYFKQINDQYGHKCGDKALIVIARLLSKQGRSVDFVARFGGEEFVMLLPDTDVQSAAVVVNKLLTSIANSSFNANGNKLTITLSCGLSQVATDDDADRLFKRADQALYLAKQNGRNRYEIA